MELQLYYAQPFNIQVYLENQYKPRFLSLCSQFWYAL